jgi:hypothetical protein
VSVAREVAGASVHRIGRGADPATVAASVAADLAAGRAARLQAVGQGACATLVAALAGALLRYRRPVRLWAGACRLPDGLILGAAPRSRMLVFDVVAEPDPSALVPAPGAVVEIVPLSAQSDRGEMARAVLSALGRGRSVKAAVTDKGAMKLLDALFAASARAGAPLAARALMYRVAPWRPDSGKRTLAHLEILLEPVGGVAEAARRAKLDRVDEDGGAGGEVHGGGDARAGAGGGA